MKVVIPDLVSNSYFPAIAAVEMGFFKEEGIDAELELIYPVGKCYEALRDGKGARRPARMPARGRLQFWRLWQDWNFRRCGPRCAKRPLLTGVSRAAAGNAE